MKTTKIEAIIKAIEANHGTADLATIYANVARYRRACKTSKDWQAGIRGVLYRELKNGTRISRIDEATYHLN